jgi:hypothetical protein
MADPDTTGKRLADNVALTLISRGAMIFATVIGLPIAGWMMNRAVASVDRIAEKVETIRDQSFQTSGTVKLIQQNQDVQTRTIYDHETRVRVLENYNRSRATTPN